MNKLKQAFAPFTFFLFGFLLSFIGISNPNSAEATMKDIQNRLAFGKKDSPVVVYFFSDWYCPSCKKVEPVIEKIFPQIKSKAAFYFVDYPIHKKSMNYTPYNLAFMINDKSNYLVARDALLQLTKETESPNDQDVDRAAKKHHLTLKELSYLDVKGGMEFFDNLVTKYDIHSTPIVIVTNLKNNKQIKLDGSNEITGDAVLKAIDKLSSSK